MCTNCCRGPDYHGILNDKFETKEPMTAKEINDLFLFDAIRVYEKILRNKVELRRIEAMKKEYDI